MFGDGPNMVNVRIYTPMCTTKIGYSIRKQRDKKMDKGQKTKEGEIIKCAWTG